MPFGKQKPSPKMSANSQGPYILRVICVSKRHFHRSCFCSIPHRHNVKTSSSVSTNNSHSHKAFMDTVDFNQRVFKGLGVEAGELYKEGLITEIAIMSVVLKVAFGHHHSTRNFYSFSQAVAPSFAPPCFLPCLLPCSLSFL